MLIAMKNPLHNTIHWINAAFSSQNDGVEATIHPVSNKSEATYFGVTVGSQWVIGADGTLTVFDSPGAARRFLKLLGFHHTNWRSSGKSPPVPQYRSLQMYRLRGQQLQDGVEQD